MPTLVYWGCEGMLRKKTAKSAPTTGKAQSVSATASLPLPTAVTSTPLATTQLAKVPKKQDKNVLPKNGLVKKKAMAILALRIDGWTNDEIAAELNIKTKSVNQYIYLAGRNGWLARRDGSVIGDAKDDVEMNILPRVLRNLKEFLDSDDEDVRKEVTLKTAEGTLHKRFANETVNPTQMTALTINIVQPPSNGPQAQIREGTTHGVPMFVEGQVVSAEGVDVVSGPTASDKPHA